MAMSAPTIDGLTLPQYGQYVTATQMQVGVVGLFVYEYVITLRQEVNYFWGRKINGAAVLLFLNRYISLLLYLLDMLSSMTLSDESCTLMEKTLLSVEMIPYFVQTSFSGLRAYALSNNRMLSAFIFLLGCVPIGVNYADFYFAFTGVNLPILGCQASDSVTLKMERSFVIASRTCLIASDFLLILITWGRLHRARQSQTGSMTKSFSAVLLRDGTIYFLVLVVLNILHLTLTLLSETIVLQYTSIVTELTEPLSTILISRFLFNLQAADRASQDMESSESCDGDMMSKSRSHMSSVVFDRVVGSLGAEIDSEAFLGREDTHPMEGSADADESEMEACGEKGQPGGEIEDPNGAQFGTEALSRTLGAMDLVEEVV